MFGGFTKEVGTYGLPDVAEIQLPDAPARKGNNIVVKGRNYIYEASGRPQESHSGSIYSGTYSK